MHPTAVPYHKLVLNPAINARGKLTDGDVADLVASIPAKGLLQPLLVRPKKNGTYEIAEGSRRHRAIGILIKKKLWKKDAKVPVLCQHMTDEQGREASLLANVQRVDLAPAEEAIAFKKLEEDGQSADAIAAHFGVPVRRVQQRLAIGKLPQPILNALEDGTINVDAAQAFTLSKDEGLQLQVFNDMEKTGRFWPNAIRDALVRKSVSSTSREAKFVGEADYIAAGGTVTRDLFSENAFFEDGPLLQKLFDQKIETAREALLAQGWSDVVIARDGKPNVWNFSKSTPDEKNLSDKARKRLAAIGKELKALDKRNDEIQEDSEADGDELDRIMEQQEALEEESRALRAEAFSDRQKKKCIAIISIDYSSVSFHLGLLPPNEKGKARGGSTDEGAGSHASLHPGAGRNQAFEEADFAGALLDDMSVTMDKALRQAMMMKPQAAWFCMLASMVMAAQANSHESPLHAGQGRNGDGELDAVMRALFGAAGDEETDVALPGFADVLARLEGLEPEALGRLSGLLIARHLNVTRRLGHDSVKALIARMDPDVAKMWQPDEAFFKRLKSHDLQECLIEVNHGALPAGLPAKPKKPELVAKALELAVPAGWLPKPLRTQCYTGPGSDHYKAAPEAEPAPPGGNVETEAAREEHEAA